MCKYIILVPTDSTNYKLTSVVFIDIPILALQLS